jgi:hypothetical protein
MTRSWWWLAVDALAVYRLAVLVTKDQVAEPLRQKVLARSERAFYFVTCPWCVSIWIAGGVVALTRFYPTEWQYAALALALSGVAGFLAER